MHKNNKLFTPVIILLMVLSLVLTTLILTVDRPLFILSALLSAVIFGVVFFLLRQVNTQTSIFLKEVGDSIEYANTDAFIDTQMPVLSVYQDGEIIWYNQVAKEQLFPTENLLGEGVHRLFPELDFTKSSDYLGEDVAYNGRRFTAFVTVGVRNGQNVSVIYLIDDTETKQSLGEYRQTRPSVALVLVDSYEELLQDYRDLDRARIMGAIEDLIRAYFTTHFGFVVRMERDRFMVIIQERGVQSIISGKFDLLDQVRALEVGEKISTTLSIGLGHQAENLDQSREMANQALDMCLGRGGDQAAIRTERGYEFFGGVSTGVERRTKIKTRIIASALGELIEDSSNVLIMGHRFADLDALGAAIGLLKAGREINPQIYICIDQEKNLVNQMLERLKTEGGYTDQDFLSPQKALQMVGRNTLLIVVDAHVPNVLESEELYRAAPHVVVIDHHRRLVGYIQDAVIFYHEPHASSTSEMVTELIQYFPKPANLGRLEAEALLAGITLDTKNFVMRTGVRTFEAAAYLRQQGADTVEVRRMFSFSMDSYKNKSAIVAEAQLYKNCAIAMADEQFESIRVTASQAADDLMNISGTNASFVIFPYDGVINVSARSMGSINVQVVMESLGGGGHLTMAAAQFPQDSIEHVLELVKKAIDEFYESLPPDRQAILYQPVVVSAVAGEVPDEGTILEGQVLEDVKTAAVEN